MILGPSGENVYPDELEDVYRDSPYVKELSIVGLPAENGPGEIVAMMVVPDYEQKGEELERGLVRERLQEHIKSVSAKLPLYKRVKITHFTDIELPKTATRKVKRKLVVEEMQKLERLKKRAEETRADAKSGDDWIHTLVATVANKDLEGRRRRGVRRNLHPAGAAVGGDARGGAGESGRRARLVGHGRAGARARARPRGAARGHLHSVDGARPRRRRHARHARVQRGRLGAGGRARRLLRRP